MSWLCKVFGHNMYFNTSNVAGPSTCKRCGHKQEGIRWPSYPMPEVKPPPEKNMTIKALDHMVKEGLYEYSTDTWGSDDRTQNYNSMEGYSGQVDYNGEIFVVTHEDGGGAGMGGYPPSVNILRIKQ